MKDISTYVDNRDGKVQLYVRYKGERFKLSTTITSPVKFVGTDVPKTVTGYKGKSTMLRRWYTDIEEYMASHPDMDAAEMKAALKAILQGTDPSKTTKGRTLVDVLRTLAETKKTENTRRAYRCTAKNVETYDPSALMGDITPAWLTDFENHELTKSRPSQQKDGKGKARVGRKPNGVAIDLRNIRAAFNWAISNGWTDNYPFRRYKIRYEETRKRDLSLAQVRTIQTSGGRYCDTFILMLYLIGINISDLYHLPKDCIRDGRLEYRRNKTGRLFSIKVEPEAKVIIDRYKGADHLLCFAETCKDYKVFLHHMNKALDDLVKGCTSYWSRHTWASMAAALDIPVETISRALGHSVGASVTSIYIHFDNKKVDEANRKVIDHIHKTPHPSQGRTR